MYQKNKNKEIYIVLGLCKIEVSVDSDIDYICIYIKVYW